MNNKWQILISLSLVLCVLISCVFSVSAEDGVNKDTLVTIEDADITANKAYKIYSEKYSDYIYGQNMLLTADNITSKSENSIISSAVNGTDKKGVIIPDDGYVSWKFSTSDNVKYAINVTYIAAEASSGNIELEFKIDGEAPFSNVNIISFERIYEQQKGDFATNISGNHLKPTVSEVFKWQEKFITDASGYTTEPFVFGFGAGEHEITLKGSRGSVAINAIELTSLNEIKTYDQYIKDLGSKVDKRAENSDVIIEAEQLSTKSSVTIIPTTDRSSAGTSPQSPAALLLNTMGGDKWKSVGNAATWEFTVNESGMYEISTRFLQDLKDGIFTCRKLYIDGELPFAEAADLRFDYSSSWQCEKFGNENGSFAFWLDKGPHTITLEVTTGEVADIIDTVSSSMIQLNRIDRRIKMITGNKVDTNRDYNFAELIPNEIKQMRDIADDLQRAVDNINQQAGTNGSFVAVIQKLIFQLEKMSDNPRTIAKHLSRFQSNLGSLGEWLLSATEQPLEIDKIYINPMGKETPKASVGFFKELWFSIECFFFTYVTDYSAIGADETGNTDKELVVWVQTGRDQGQIVRELIDASFSKEQNASVKLQIVASGLLQSVLAGIAPDVVCDCIETLPLEYALRNAVMDLTQFSDYKETFDRFDSAAYKPASFNGATYGMPQTFSYLMMFYRTDIFEEYGYTIPQTWSQLCEMIPSMQRNGMEIGIPHSLDLYTTLLYQRGGKLYKNNGAKTNLTDYTSITAFNDMTELFTLYDCPVSYNFANRFRSGEMPLAIAAYTEYNQLTAFAPEIKGLWKMVPIPGTPDEDGEINNVSVGNSTFLVIMNDSKNKDLAWEFLKWYTSTDVQSSYAIQMESIQGTCAKVASANTEALAQMTWSSTEYKELFSQMKKIDNVPQYPGSYYLSRIMSFAFNRVYNNDENPKEVISDYIKELNEELARKREEFGLESEDNEE